MTTGSTAYAFDDRPTRVLRRTPSGVVHTMVVLGAWALAALVTLAVAADTKIGPVVLRITTNHGLHAGDVYAMLVMGAFATVVTVVAAVQYVLAGRR